mmetsp:Transcript_940/g.5926  ORF Transcript_940/g.5926 Transcript_940/m.5926 type:complete len:160 (+) Transcript_940:150-629(+)
MNVATTRVCASEERFEQVIEGGRNVEDRRSDERVKGWSNSCSFQPTVRWRCRRNPTSTTRRSDNLASRWMATDGRSLRWMTCVCMLRTKATKGRRFVESDVGEIAHERATVLPRITSFLHKFTTASVRFRYECCNNARVCKRREIRTSDRRRQERGGSA